MKRFPSEERGEGFVLFREKRKIQYSCGEAGRSVEGMILVNMLGFLEGWQGC